MKQSAFIVILFVIAFAISIAIYNYVLGSHANFKDAKREVAVNMMGQIYTGGPLVAL